MPIKPDEISHLVSHALRHAPDEYGLILDSEGWVTVDELLAAMQSLGGQWALVKRGDLETMVQSSTKRRHEIRGDRIRAMYGHSLTSTIARQASHPPTILFHGTSDAAWASIKTEGLKPMQRQHVHLSDDVETATSVGRRKGNPPTLLTIRAQEAEAAGTIFSQGNDTVWLANFVPSDFIDKAPGAS